MADPRPADGHCAQFSQVFPEAPGPQSRFRSLGAGRGRCSRNSPEVHAEADRGDRVGEGPPGTESSHPFPSQGVILDMISDNMLSCPESRGFLIDGFPRELKQAKEFERIVSDPRVWEGWRGTRLFLPPHLGWRSEGVIP